MNLTDDTRSNVFNQSIEAVRSVAMPQVHTVLIVTLGTRMAAIAPALATMTSTGRAALVPYRVISLDTLGYEQFVQELAKQGWTREQVERAIPAENYFELRNPFNEEFDWEDRGNAELARLVQCKQCRQYAKRKEFPGSGGLPILGRVRVESERERLEPFFQHHVNELTGLAPEALQLREGVLMFVVTSYCGGTGTGGSAVAGAILRSLRHHHQIHACIQMPCVSVSGRQERANAYAAILANNHFHRNGGYVELMNRERLEPPFDSVRLTFGHNGTHKLSETDGLMHEAEILMRYLHVPTQQLIATTAIQLNGAKLHDMYGQPTQLRVELAQTVQVIPPGVHDYLALQWIWQDLEEAKQRYEGWLKDPRTSDDEETRVDALFKALVTENRLDLASLLARLDAAPTTASQLRTFFESLRARVAGMKAEPIRQGIDAVAEQVCALFTRSQRTWTERACELAAKLPEQLVEQILARFGAEPQLALALLARLRKHLAAIAAEAKRVLEQAKNRRLKSNDMATTAKATVHSAQPAFLSFNYDEVVRDAALAYVKICAGSASARLEQELHELVVLALEGHEIRVLDARGRQVTMASVEVALQDLARRWTSEARRRFADKLQEVRSELDRCAQKLRKRSLVFQRSLLYDSAGVEDLDKRVASLRGFYQGPPLTAGYVDGSRTLEQTCAALVPIFPEYADAGRDIAQLLRENPKMLDHLAALLTGVRPFSKIDKVIERQQRLGTGRDVLRLIEIPGGENGELRQILQRARLLGDSSVRIVESGDKSIRSYYLRTGLPYYALEDMTRYEREYDAYVKDGEQPSPHVVPDGLTMRRLRVPDANLRDHTVSVLFRLKAVFPDRLTSVGDGFLLRYDVVERGVSSKRHIDADRIEDLVTWAVKNPETVHAFEALLKQHLTTSETDHIACLTAAFSKAAKDGQEAEFLRQALLDLKLDPLGDSEEPAEPPTGTAFEEAAK